MTDTLNVVQLRTNGHVDAQEIPQDVYTHGGMCAWIKNQFPNSTGYQVEAVTGIPATTVEGWFTREYKPSLKHFMRLLVVFGPSFQSACMTVSPVWLNQACQEQKRKDLEAQISRLNREIDSLVT